ncbi:hypothetical protein GCK72_001649 [Caenorhabditis remanei]|uniref:Uncharacterized protein n=1 Tax=Caenorhabditis remanei TaxID=31234 RepID=A0A6A5HVP6_CAERE|nr:hypothetical protein GCK72_001649 [Caenorhabditis remanei]KAF1769832.1 hypothetical protein GCK72_001649 [Caenorhabditis remanei]
MSNQALEPLVEVDPSNFDDEDFENRDATWEDLENSLKADAIAADRVFKAKTMIEMLERMEEFFMSISRMSKVYISYHNYVKRLIDEKQGEDDDDEEEAEENKENRARG